MADATAGALSPETMVKLTAASANGRMLLGMLALWMDREAIPADLAVAEDTRGLSDEDAEAVVKSIPARDNPERLNDAMVTILEDIGRLDGMSTEHWRLVRRLAGEWVPR